MTVTLEICRDDLTCAVDSCYRDVGRLQSSLLRSLVSTPRRRGNLARPFEETDVAQSATLESYAPVPLADAPECSVEY